MIRVFWTEIWKKYCHIWNQHLQISVIAKFCEDKKCLNLGPKMPYLGIRFLEKLLLYLKSAPSNLSKKTSRKFHEKIKMSKFWTKEAWFGYSWIEIWKQYCPIWNQHSRICLLAEFRGKTKMHELGIKNTLIGYFWAWIFKSYCHIWNQHLQKIRGSLFLKVRVRVLVRFIKYAHTFIVL